MTLAGGLNSPSRDHSGTCGHEAEVSKDDNSISPSREDQTVTIKGKLRSVMGDHSIEITAYKQDEENSSKWKAQKSDCFSVSIQGDSKD